MSIAEKITKGHLRPLLLCSAFGALGSLPYFFEKAFLLTFVSVFGQIWVISKIKSEKQKIFLPFLFYFFGMYVFVYSFLSELYPYSRFGFTSFQAVFVLICSCVLIPLYHALLQATCITLIKFVPDNALRIPFFGFVWIISEWIISVGTLAFPWASISISLTGVLPYLQTASLFGKYFITFITVSGIAAIVYALNSKAKIFASLGISAILINLLAGTIMCYTPQKTCGSALNVAALQGNIRSNEKWDSDNQGSILDNYISLIEEAAEEGATLVVLPESAIPQSFSKGNALYNIYTNTAKKYNITIIAGVNYRSGEAYYNGVVAIYPNGSISDVYGKRHLVPFGEYVPYADILGVIFPFIADFNEDTNTVTIGDNATVIQAEEGCTAPLVCFDSIFPSLAREGVLNGAQYLTVVTNDSWFEDSIGCYTHLRDSQLRAIENRRYVVRAANTGISAFIDSKGNIINCTEPLEKTVLYGEIDFINDTTLYTITGDIFLYISFSAVALIIINYIIRRIKNGKNTITSK